MINENETYVVTTPEEDKWFREMADKEGYIWASGESLLESSYFNYYRDKHGYCSYTLSLERGGFVTGYLDEEDVDKKVIFIKDLMKDENKPDYVVEIKDNKVMTSSKYGSACVELNEPNKDDIFNAIKVTLDTVYLPHISEELHDFLGFLCDLDAATIESRDGCIYGYDNDNQILFGLRNNYTDFDFMKEGVKYKLDDLLS